MPCSRIARRRTGVPIAPSRQMYHKGCKKRQQQKALAAAHYILQTQRRPFRAWHYLVLNRKVLTMKEDIRMSYVCGEGGPGWTVRGACCAGDASPTPGPCATPTPQSARGPTSRRNSAKLPKTRSLGAALIEECHAK